MAQGYVYKRCRHDGSYVITGTPARGARPPVPACRDKHGSWSYRVEAGKDPVTGARRQPSRGGFPTRAAAQEALNDMLNRLATGTTSDDRGHTVATWLVHWLAAGTWEPTTRTGYESDVHAHLIPLIGSVRLRDLRRTDVSSLLTELGRKDVTRVPRPGRGGRTVAERSPRTVDKVRRTLRAALGCAVEDNLIVVNPAVGRFKAIGKRGVAQAVWWQPEQLSAFLTHIADDELAALWTVAGLAGLRRSELCGLRWVDVDLTSEQPGITVRQKVVTVAGDQSCPHCPGHRGRKIRPGAKSDAGARWVPLTSESVTELLAHQARQEAHRQELGDHYTDHGLVFAEDDGSPLRPDAVTKRHGQLVAEAELPKIVLHEMRHGAVSLLAAAGLSFELIALIVGHASPAVTRGIYAHGIRSQLSEAADAAAQFVRDAD